MEADRDVACHPDFNSIVSRHEDPTGLLKLEGTTDHSSMYQLNYSDLSTIIHTFIMISKGNLKFAILIKFLMK